MNTLEMANQEASKITQEMDAIFAKHPGCEAPEFMPASDYNDWGVLWQLRRSLFDRISAFERAEASLLHFLKMEVI